MKDAVKHTLQISTPTERDIVFRREFDAPRRLVFEALTKCDLLKRWLGARNGWSLAVCEMDLTVGGKYRWVWHGSKGEVMGMGGVFREITAPERIVATERFDDAWYEGEALDTTVLTEQGGRTTLTLTVTYASKEVRDMVMKSPAATGLGENYDVLETMLSSMA
jgi:uncharacterized protein YndB with AHSA1/START domain